ncbi:MAG: hypothetical protein VKL42_09695 [Snowella sp.]|nr:hypothetical protein [Snowella sp.]
MKKEIAPYREEKPRSPLTVKKNRDRRKLAKIFRQPLKTSPVP